MGYLFPIRYAIDSCNPVNRALYKHTYIVLACVTANYEGMHNAALIDLSSCTLAS